MQVLIAVIEKTGTEYIARCPNLPGVSITADTYDSAQDAIIEAVEKRYNQLLGMHAEYKSVSRLPIDQSVYCVYKYTDQWRKDNECSKPSLKDGLCHIHWKMLYSHAFGNSINLKACPLCGENDVKVLKRWDTPCSVKIENPEWATLLEEKKVKMRVELEKEKQDVKLQKLGNKPRCKKVLTNGQQCFNEVYRERLCERHYERLRR